MSRERLRTVGAGLLLALSLAAMVGDATGLDAVKGLHGSGGVIASLGTVY